MLEMPLSSDKSARTAASFLISSAAAASLALSAAHPGIISGRLQQFCSWCCYRSKLVNCGPPMPDWRVLTGISELIQREILRKSLMSEKPSNKLICSNFGVTYCFVCHQEKHVQFLAHIKVYFTEK